MLTIHVGSTSIHKVNAVRSACKKVIKSDIEILSHEVNSGVPSQPYGLSETVRGAINRAESVWEKDCLAFGIEGGLFDLMHMSTKGNSIYFCMAVVCLIDQNGSKFFATSAGMQFPNDKIIKAQELGVTVGKVIADEYGGDHTDPRKILSNNRANRQDSIEEAVRLTLFNIF